MDSVCALLRTEEGSKAAPNVAKKLWPLLLGLLSDPTPAIRQHAAIAVGTMGAIATKPSAIANPAHGYFQVLHRAQGLAKLSHAVPAGK